MAHQVTLLTTPPWQVSLKIMCVIVKNVRASEETDEANSALHDSATVTVTVDYFKPQLFLT